MKADKLAVIKSLQTILGGVNQFVLTGSTIAELQGLTDKSGDIDIVLIGVPSSTIDLLDRHVKHYPVHQDKVNITLHSKQMFVFKYQGFKVDVFIKEVPYDDSLTYSGIIISPLMKLVEAKKSYNRLKDVMQLRDWSRKMFKQEEFMSDLEKVVTNTGY
jgi:hypothetical protein